jgi:hypothetical protein
MVAAGVLLAACTSGSSGDQTPAPGAPTTTPTSTASPFAGGINGPITASTEGAVGRG